MRYLVSSAMLLTALGFSLAGPDAPKAEAAREAARDVQDFVYLGDKGPVLIRFHVRIDGKPLLDVWEDFIGKVFDYVDLNGDGELSMDEAARMPSLPVLFNNGPGIAGQDPRIRMMIDRNKNGTITREKLADWYRLLGAGPFQFGTERPQLNQKIVLLAGQPQPPSADALNKKLFTLLDADKDGKLSRVELTRAPIVLQKQDIDDDELVSAQEMNGDAPNNIEGTFVVARMPGNAPQNNSPFVLVSPGRESGKKLAAQLQERYGPKGEKPSARKLTRENLGFDEATFAILDEDEDGLLDGEELAQFSQLPPDLEFRVRLGKKSGKEASVELVAPKGQPSPLAQSVRPGSGGTLVLESGTTHIELGLATESGNMRFVPAVKQPSVKQPYKDLQEAAFRSCASLSVKDQGRGLFDMADANGDGRLSVRELRQMVKLIDQLDRDGDGQVSLREIPHKYRLDVKQGPAGGNQFTPAVVAVRKIATREPDLPRRTAGPMWFRKMDRNRDGDVSRREFLGTAEEFRRIDTDGDGLISSEEAERADKLFRKTKN